MNKTCCMCKETKDTSSFIKRGTYKNGEIKYRSMCSNCEKKRNLDRYHRTKADGTRAKISYKYTLRTKYGLTIEDFNDLYEIQKGVCDICFKPIKNPFLNTEGRKVSVDHCHTTGKVRGLLCNTCNTGLGGLQDNTDILESAIYYLEKHK